MPRLIVLLLLLVVHPLSAADFEKDLTFRATFDNGTDAMFALGDKRIFTASDYKEQAAAKPGIGNPDITVAAGQGRQGGALKFGKKNTHAIFYKAEKNVSFDQKNWTGTISFWLSLDPEQDLAPGYCDPIQVTDKAYNDSAIWVDFTRDDKPRHFRLGVFGDLKAWNPENRESDKNPDFLRRLVVAQKTPFGRGKWTHVAITYRNLGTDGSAILYLDGKRVGETRDIREPFAWNQSNSAIRLGVGYTGLMDDIAVFRRALTAEEIGSIATGKF